MKRIDITITEKLIKEIDKLKVVSGLSRSEIIRRALDAYLSTKKGNK